MLNDRRAVDCRVFRATLVHTERRIIGPVAVIETGVVTSGTNNTRVEVVARARFRANDRIARTVGREGEKLTFVEVEEGSVRKITVAGGLRR